MKEVGKVTHWYDKICVAVIKLSKNLNAGDRVKIKRGNNEFEETVSSIQLNHKDISSAKKGDEVAVKFSQKAKEGATVFLVE